MHKRKHTEAAKRLAAFLAWDFEYSIDYYEVNSSPRIDITIDNYNEFVKIIQRIQPYLIDISNENLVHYDLPTSNTYLGIIHVIGKKRFIKVFTKSEGYLIHWRLTFVDEAFAKLGMDNAFYTKIPYDFYLSIDSNPTEYHLFFSKLLKLTDIYERKNIIHEYFKGSISS